MFLPGYGPIAIADWSIIVRLLMQSLGVLSTLKRLLMESTGRGGEKVMTSSDFDYLKENGAPFTMLFITLTLFLFALFQVKPPSQKMNLLQMKTPIKSRNKMVTSRSSMTLKIIDIPRP
jgi:hypothetical protein